MQELTTEEFFANAEKILVNAAANDDFVKIRTKAGNAVLISEAEWNILVAALKAVLTAK